MIITENIKFINKKLKDVYGIDIAVSQPRFRVVWTSDQYEIRKNSSGFDIYSEGGIFLRTEFGPHEVEKYPFFPEKWVLEQLNDSTGNPEIQARWSYEPKWIFGAANSDPTPLWKACDLLVKLVLFVQDRPKQSPSDVLDLEEKRMAAEKELFKTMMRNDSEPLVSKMVAGEAVSVPSTYERTE